MIEVAIANQQTALAIDEARLRDAVARVLREAGQNHASISVAIVDDGTMHDLNRQFLNHDYTTDVLSFVLEENAGHLDGEIVANAEYAHRSAAELGWNPQHELLLYVIHGTLHLVGHDDQDPEALAIMRQREQVILAQLGISPPDS